MTTVTFSELRNNAKKYFDKVERGQTIEVYRNGKPVATLAPIKRSRPHRWAEPTPLKIPGASLSEAILADRYEE